MEALDRAAPVEVGWFKLQQLLLRELQRSAPCLAGAQRRCFFRGAHEHERLFSLTVL